MFSLSNPVSDRPPFMSLIRIFLIIILGFVVLGPLVGALATMSFYDGDLLQDISKSEPPPHMRNALLVMQATASFVGLILLPLIYVTLLERKTLNNYFILESNMPLMLGTVAVIGLVFPIAMSPVASWNLGVHFPEFMSGFETWARSEEDRLAKFTDLLTDINTPMQWLVAMIVIALLPAIGEELVFRGLVQLELWRASKNIHLAIWLSAFVFSAIHMQFFGFFPRLLLGALFGYLYYWSGNLIIPIFSHFFNNGFAVTMVYLNHIKVTSIDVEDTDAAPVQYIIPCLILTALLLIYTRKHYREARSSVETISNH